MTRSNNFVTWILRGGCFDSSNNTTFCFFPGVVEAHLSLAGRTDVCSCHHREVGISDKVCDRRTASERYDDQFVGGIFGDKASHICHKGAVIHQLG